MINFIDKDHKNFFYSKLDKLQSLRKTDVYYLSLVYTLSICETTREHFSNIFNIEKGEINLDAIKAGWQTGTSEKVTRMAFNLWNHSIMFDSEEDLENEKRKKQIFSRKKRKGSITAKRRKILMHSCKKDHRNTVFGCWKRRFCVMIKSDQ